jgi:hypothetical protein
LFKVRPRGKGLGHVTFLLSPVVRWQAASRLCLYSDSAGGLGPFRGPGCILNAAQINHS